MWPMKKSILGLVAIGALIAAPAMAADLRMPVKAPPAPIAPVYSWTGFYIGGSVGGVWDTVDGSFVFPPLATFAPNHSTLTADAHVGFQYQFQNIVLGVEGDFIENFRNTGNSDTCHPAASCGAGSTLTSGIRDDMWTAGGRAGWSFGQWLPYVSGGWASANFRTEAAAPGVGIFEATNTRHSGAYFGGGIDWRVWNNLVAGIEYRHYWFGSVTAVPTLTATGLPNPADTWTLKPSADAVSFRLSWLFNFGGPIAAHY